MLFEWRDKAFCETGGLAVIMYNGPDPWGGKVGFLCSIWNHEFLSNKLRCPRNDAIKCSSRVGIIRWAISHIPGEQMSQFSASEQSGSFCHCCHIWCGGLGNCGFLSSGIKCRYCCSFDVLNPVFVPPGFSFICQGSFFCICAVMCTHFRMLLIHARVEQPQFVLG